MTNYRDKYIKYKTKYIELKNHHGAGFDELFDKLKANTLIEENRLDKIKANNLKEENKTLFENYGIYSEGDKILPYNELMDNLKSIHLIESKKTLFENYNVYKKGNKIPSFSDLLDNLKSINLIEENTILFEKYSVYKVYKKDSKIPSFSDLLDNLKSINLIEENIILFEKYDIYKKDNKIPPSKDLLDNLKSINLIEENIHLFEKYGVYKKDNKIPPSEDLIYNLKSLNLIEKNKNIFEKHGILIESDKIPPLNELIDILLKENIHLFIKYGIYKDKLPTKNVLIDFMQTIDLIENNTVLKSYMETNPDKIYNDIIDIQNINNDCKIIKWPDTFYISGLITFAVYKNVKLNKIIYLLGEQHSFENLCYIDEKDKILHYTAEDFFFSLLNCAIPNKFNNKLDVFLELDYDPNTKKFKKTVENYNESYFFNTAINLYDKNCKPKYIKTKSNDNKICVYDKYIRFHHADLRWINNPLFQYFATCWELFRNDDEKIQNNYKDKIDKLYNSYDNKTLLKINRLMQSQYLSKIHKQIKNIEIDSIKKFFLNNLIVMINKTNELITSGDIDYENIIKIYSTNEIPDFFDKLQEIYCGLMDFYLMTRVFRYFDKRKYNSSNIIIYGGDHHIQKYIEWLQLLDFEEKYNVNSISLEDIACLKIDNFNIEYL